MKRLFLTDDLNLQGHRIVDWRWLNDIPTDTAVSGQVLAFDGTDVKWATLTSEGFVSVDWDDITGKPTEFPPEDHTQAWSTITGKPTEFPPEAHTQDWGTITGKPTFVNSVTAGNGITVSSQTGNVQISESYHVDTLEPGGFVEPWGSYSSTQVVTNNRTFTIAPVADEFSFYCQGVKYTKTATDSITFPDSEGNHFIYFDSDGVLTSSQTFPEESVFRTGAFCAAVYWDTSAGSVLIFGEERHGIRMDGRTHWYLHNVFGSQYISGMALGNITADGDGSSNSHCTLSAGGGIMADEDLFEEVIGTAATYTDWGVFSKTDTGDWEKTASGSIPYLETANHTPLINVVSGATWSTSQVANNSLFLAHVFRTNSTTRPFIAVVGENVYGSISAARLGATEELATLYTEGLPFVEYIPLGTLIYEHRTSFTNTYNTRIRLTDEGNDYVDWRTTKLLSSGTGPSDHGSLGGLVDKDHPTTALQQTGAATNQAVVWNGTSWIPDDVVLSLAAGTGVSLSTSTGAVTVTCDLDASELGGSGYASGNVPTWSGTASAFVAATPSGGGGGGDTTAQTGTYQVYITQSDQTVHSTTTTTDIPDWTVDLITNTRYMLNFQFVRTGDALYDFRFKLAASGLTDSSAWYSDDQDNPNANMTTYTLGNSFPLLTLSGSTIRTMANRTVYIETGTVAGTITAQFAQFVAGSTSTRYARLCGGGRMEVWTNK